MHRKIEGLLFDVPSPSLYIFESPHFVDCFIEYKTDEDGRYWVMSVKACGRPGYYQLGFTCRDHAIWWLWNKIRELHLEVDSGGRVIINGDREHDGNSRTP